MGKTNDIIKMIFNAARAAKIEVKSIKGRVSVQAKNTIRRLAPQKPVPDITDNFSMKRYMLSNPDADILLQNRIIDRLKVYSRWDGNIRRFNKIVTEVSLAYGIDYGKLKIPDGITEIINLPGLCSIEVPSSLEYIYNAAIFDQCNFITLHTDNFYCENFNSCRFTGINEKAVVFDLGNVKAKLLFPHNRTTHEVSLVYTDFMKKCFENSGGKFMNLSYYDENMLSMPFSLKFKLKAAYERLFSGYRLSEKCREQYGSFLKYHGKKLGRIACDRDNAECLEFCIGQGFVNDKNINAIREYAVLKNAAKCLDIISC